MSCKNETLFREKQIDLIRESVQRCGLSKKGRRW